MEGVPAILHANVEKLIGIKVSYARASCYLLDRITYRQRQQRDILVPMVDKMNDLDGRLARTSMIERLVLRDAARSKYVCLEEGHTRIAFLGVDQIRDFEIQGQVRLIVLRVTSISYHRQDVSTFD